MKRLLSFAIALLLISFSGFSHAIEVSNINVPQILKLPNQIPLELNGAGIREKYFFNIYVAALYSSTIPVHTANAVLEQPNIAITLHITSGRIASIKMKEFIYKGFDDATNGNRNNIAINVEQFANAFTKNVKTNDFFAFYFDQNTGVSIYKNGVLLNTIKGEAFRKALFNIWLGKNAIQEDLKQALLAL